MLLLGPFLIGLVNAVAKRHFFLPHYRNKSCGASNLDKGVENPRVIYLKTRVAARRNAVFPAFLATSSNVWPFLFIVDSLESRSRSMY